MTVNSLMICLTGFASLCLRRGHPENGCQGRRIRSVASAECCHTHGASASSLGISTSLTSWAEDEARARGLSVAVHKPDLDTVFSRWEAVDRYYARNQRIVDDSDMIVAFVAPDRTGGTEDTIRRAVHATTAPTSRLWRSTPTIAG
jgi:hypothetical protein